jgi:hypothetical protein
VAVPARKGQPRRVVLPTSHGQAFIPLRGQTESTLQGIDSLMRRGRGTTQLVESDNLDELERRPRESFWHRAFSNVGAPS